MLAVVVAPEMTPWLDQLREVIPDVALLVWVVCRRSPLRLHRGSINPAAIIARIRGADLRGTGSGNPGATNAGRVMGWKVGVLVGSLDLLKGYLPVILVAVVAGDGPARVAGLLAVIGHITSPWLRGRGGKGVATALGAILAVRPVWALPVLAVFGVVVGLTRNVGLASVCGALALVPAALLFRYDNVDLLFAVALAGIICVRHSRNLRQIVDALRGRQGSRAAEHDPIHTPASLTVVHSRRPDRRAPRAPDLASRGAAPVRLDPAAGSHRRADPADGARRDERSHPARCRAGGRGASSAPGASGWGGRRTRPRRHRRRRGAPGRVADVAGAGRRRERVGRLGGRAVRRGPSPSIAVPPASAEPEVVVQVVGTVRRPGLVRLPAGARVGDAIAAAGGLRSGRSAGLLNLARRVVDGEQIAVGVTAPPRRPRRPGPPGRAPPGRRSPAGST